MKRKTIKKEEVVELTRKAIRSFYQRDITQTISYVHDDFVWIGALDFQFAQGKKAFLDIIQSELDAEPFQMFDEEYTLLTRDRDTFVVYSCFKLFSQLEQGEEIRTHTRITAVWEYKDDGLYLTHIHGSNAQDIPIQMTKMTNQNHEDVAFFEYLKRIDQSATGERLAFRDTDGKYQFFLPSEVVYLQANGQSTIVYTENQTIQVSGILGAHTKKLPACFHRIHKSYAVHEAYAHSLCRYTLTLLDGTTLPVGKERYMELKRVFCSGQNKVATKD